MAPPKKNNLGSTAFVAVAVFLAFAVIAVLAKGTVIKLLGGVTELQVEEIVAEALARQEAISGGKQSAGGGGLRVEAGTVDGSQERDTWALYVGSGQRYHRKEVLFKEPFTKKPTVMVALKKFNFESGDAAGSADNPRIEIYTEPLDDPKTGFVAVFKTWDDAKVYAAQMNWIAVGE